MIRKNKNIDLIVRELAECPTNSFPDSKTTADYRKIWDLTGRAKNLIQIDINAEWTKLNKRLEPVETYIMPTNRPLQSVQYLRYAAVVFIFLCLVAGLYLLIQPAEKQSFCAINAPQSTTTPDGSIIDLNSGSSIKYISRTSHGLRKVQLQGQGYFEVKKDAYRPFIVKAGDLRVEVTGTGFYINYPADASETEVIVKNGSVLVFRQGQSRTEAISLKPSEKLVYTRSSRTLNKTSAESENYLSWKTQRLVFNDVALSTVIKDINLLYQSNIIISSESIKNCRITATFEHQPLEAVLNIIRNTLSVEIREQNGKFEITGSGC